MSMHRRQLICALACASSFSLAAASFPATAQRIDRIVVFGDSYADTGNAFRLGYANPQALAVYPTGRFSGGSNYIDTLSQILSAPVENFAIGGAMGGTNNGTLCFDATYGAPLCGKGLQYEVDQFLNVGTQSSVFPNASTTFTRSDLLAISIGGNDARIYQQGGGPLATAGAAGTAAGAATAVQLNRLVAQGNPTISFLALNGAIAPEVALDPNAQAIRGAYSSAYYASLQPALAGYAANGAIVHYLDGTILAQEVSANAATYGFSRGLVCPIFPNSTCLFDASGYLFNGDALHLTSQGFQLVAQYVARQLAAPLTLQAPSDLGLATARQWGRTLSSRGDLYGRSGVVDGFHVYIVGDAFSDDVRSSAATSSFNARGYGGTIGAEYGVGGALFGVAGNYSRPKVRFDDSSARINGRSWQIGAYGSIDLAGLFGQAYLGYGKDRDSITRTGILVDMTAEPHGNHTLAGAKGGYLMSLAALKIGPVVALDYARAKADGYTEVGDPVLTLNVGDQSLKSLTGQGGLEVRGDFARLHAFADLTAEHDFSGDHRSISFAQTSAPTIVNHWDVPRGKDTYGRLAVGGSASLSGSFSVDAFVTTTFGRDEGKEVAGQVGLKARF
jgi:outer membrane lipase/esterase